MKNAIIETIEKRQLKSDIPAFSTGDTIKLFIKIIEGKKERLQAFEGIVIRKTGHGVNENITVRKVVDGVGVERTFLLHSPNVGKIEVIKFSKTRRARLFYLRELLGSKVMRVKEDLDKNIEAAAEKGKQRREAAKLREEETRKLVESGQIKPKEKKKKDKAAQPAAAKSAEAPKAEAPKAETKPEAKKEEPKAEQKS